MLGRRMTRASRMFGPFERAVAGRYLRARKGERFVSIIAIFSLVGIALGVATLIVVTSVMSGFQVELVSPHPRRQRPHRRSRPTPARRSTTIQPLLARIRAVPDVVSALRVLDGQVLLTTDGGGARGGLVRGITLDDLRALHPVSDHIVAGSLDRLHRRRRHRRRRRPGASCYRLRIGDPLTVISPKGAATAFGTIPRVRAYKVVAIFDAGLNDYNTGVVFLPLPRGAGVLPEAGCRHRHRDSRGRSGPRGSAVMPRLRAGAARPPTAGARLAACQRQHHRRAAGAEGHMFIVLGMIVLVAAFNVISSLIMLVKDKRGDIAVLRTIGASAGAVLRIFLMCGASSASVGTVIGTLHRHRRSAATSSPSSTSWSRSPAARCSTPRCSC